MSSLVGNVTQISCMKVEYDKSSGAACKGWISTVARLLSSVDSIKFALQLLQVALSSQVIKV